MNKASAVGLLVSCLIVAVTAGCSSSVETGGGGNGGGGGGTGGTGGGSGGAGGGGGAACAGFEDEQGSGAVTFHIRNDTPQAIYLGGNCGASPQYSVYPVGAGEDVTSWGNHDTYCLQTCEGLQTEGPIACDVCAPSVIRVNPGNAIDVTWNGTGLRPGYQMPAACYAYPGQSTCSRIVAAPPGTWAATATAFSACTGDTCTCQPDGTCWGTPSGVQATADQATFSFPSQTSVDIVFSGCAFGCP